MKTRPKSKEVLEAQLAAYTEQVQDTRNRGHLLGDIATLAAQDPSQVTRITETAEYPVGPDGIKHKKDKIPAGAERIVANRADYVQFLREAGGQDNEFISERQAYLSAYEEFAPSVDALINSIAETDAKDEHESFLGSGLSRAAFVFELDGKSYVVRVPRKGDTLSENSSMIDKALAVSMRVKDVPHMEQGVAGSYKEGRFISELLPGKDFSKTNAVEMASQVTSEQNEEPNRISVFVDTLVTASQRRIRLDPKPSNYLYDSTEGIGLIDLELAPPDESEEQLLIANASEASLAILNIGTYNFMPDTAADYAYMLEQYDASLTVLQAYREGIAERLPANAAGAVLEFIDKEAAKRHEAIAELKDPQWVEEQVRKRQAVKERMAATALGDSMPAPKDDYVD